MAKDSTKRYYWLKLKENFFEDDTIQFIEEQENGKDYVIFYLKLCLKSLTKNGKLFRLVGKKIIPYDVKSLAKLTNTNIDTVNTAMNLFKELGIIDVLNGGELYISQINELIGSETNKAQLMRENRARKSLENKGGNNVTGMLPHIEKELKKELKKEKEIKKRIETEIKELNFSDDLTKALLDFSEMRKTIKKPLTKKALNLLIVKLDKIANNEQEKIEILNNSIMNCWQGVFELKKKPANNSKIYGKGKEQDYLDKIGEW